MLQTIFAIGHRQYLSKEEQEHQRFLILMALLMGAGGLVWGSIAAAVGLYRLSSIPFGYVLLTMANLGFLWATKRFEAVRFVQVGFSILLPFAFQWMMGGFHASGAICLWALVPLASSMAFHRLKATWKWLILYVVLLVGSAWQDHYADAHAVTHDEGLRVFFYTVNICMVSVALFGLVYFFKSRNDAANEELKLSFEELQAQEEEIRQSMEELLAVNEQLESNKRRLEFSFTLERGVREQLEEKEAQLEDAMLKLEEEEKLVRSQAEKMEQANASLQQQYALIRSQNEVIELWNSNMTQSISYARRIQMALMASEEDLARHFPEYFLIEKPKEIVGGDFYWVSEIDGQVILVVADCTGHGVPGALMTIVGTSLLNEIVNQNGILLPSAILQHLDQRISEAINTQAKGQVNDGMDAVVVCFDKANKSLAFAGAHNPLWMVRNGKMHTYKGARMPVGGFQHQIKVFDDHYISVMHGDRFFLSTDGFKDQFGGPNNRKLMSKNVEELLMRTSQEPMAKQKELLRNSWNAWKGREKQTDDVLMLGIECLLQ